MAKFSITFDVDNDAFAPSVNERRIECVRILTKITGQVRLGSTGGPILDVNGNTVGEWSMPYLDLVEFDDEEE